MSKHWKQDMFSVARHEMGHYVAARVLGFRTQGVEVVLHGGDKLTAPTPHGAATVILAQCGITSIADVIRYIERRLQVLYAGSMAEALAQNDWGQWKVNEKEATDILNGERNGQSESRGSELDRSKIEEYLHLHRNLTSPMTSEDNDQLFQVNIGCQDFFTKSKGLVERHAQAIQDLATVLVNNRAGARARLEAEDLQSLLLVQDLPLET